MHKGTQGPCCYIALARLPCQTNILPLHFGMTIISFDPSLQLELLVTGPGFKSCKLVSCWAHLAFPGAGTAWRAISQ